MTRSSRRFTFLLITLAIPVVFFILLEGGLRLAGFGGKAPLFIENPAHPDYLLPRPNILNRYFPDGHAPRVTMETNFFLKEKPEDGLRLIVQGGSTAAGFPYGLGASLAGMLDNRLRQTYPQRDVEVINTAMSAVNSYLLKDVASEIAEQSPDAVLIYAGHNEYLGIFGVGSQFQFGGPLLTRLYLSLYSLATVDALQYLLLSFTSGPDELQSASRTFMAQVAQNTLIPFDSGAYRQGLRQFEANMRQVLDTYRQASIPVYLSTIASNIGDQPPLGAGSPAAAEALSLYQRGQQAMAAGEYVAARQYLAKAKDLDPLRFRAPEDINAIIRKLSRQPGVVLVDTLSVMESRTQSNIVGNSLMLEHLHPNLPGYFLIADSFYDALLNNQLASNPQPVTTAEAWRNRPVTTAEEYYGYAQIQALKSDFPFRPSPVPIMLSEPADWQQQLGKAYFEKRISWLDMMQQLHAGYVKRKNLNLELKTAALIAQALPHDPLSNEQAGDLLYKARRDAEALHFYQRAKRAGSATSNLDTRMAILKDRLTIK